ncbi:ribonuclease Oy-like [Saccostrea echinata]|uniref:ribonuclease Oy-like n=1 Tax=Saccostrea echinata TaxID=191078 RepID=UPI002A83E601|nr:ribonuclease Oy-like [Saccostrea echinata]
MKMKKLIAQCICIFGIISTVYTGEKEWDSFVLTLTWPVTMCKFCNLANKKCVVPAKIWEIHGLWPGYSNGDCAPRNCSISHPFNKDEIKDLLDQLNKYWPNQLPKRPQYDFWAHEWEAHGRCATIVKDTGTELKYFNKTLDLRLINDVGSILSSAGISPGKSYELTAVEGALKRGTGGQPLVLCGNVENKTWISEILICMNKSFKVTDCPQPNCRPKSRKKTLPPDDPCEEMVFYPESEKELY